MMPAPRAGGGRDRSIDALRAGAVVAVVSGHWLVTAVVVDDYGMSVTSPLRDLPDLAPLTWVLQALAPFFCAAGFAAARTLDGGRAWRSWFHSRAVALLPAVGTLVAFWAALLGVLLLGGFPVATLRSIGKLVVSPLWFLAVLLLLWAAWPALDRLDRRLRGFAMMLPAAVVGLDDVARNGGLAVPAHAQSVLGASALICAWMVPFLFGIRLARGGGPRRAGGLAMLLAGAAAMTVLILWAGYPASAVGVAGDPRSNLAPPSLLVLALAAVQLGLFVLVRRQPGPARRTGHPLLALNTVALPVFLWHQSALLLLVIAAAESAPVDGLAGAPEGLAWVLQRLVWFPALALVLAGLVVLLSPGRLGSAGRRPSRYRAGST